MVFAWPLGIAQTWTKLLPPFISGSLTVSCLSPRYPQISPGLHRRMARRNSRRAEQWIGSGIGYLVRTTDSRTFSRLLVGPQLSLAYGCCFLSPVCTPSVSVDAPAIRLLVTLLMSRHSATVCIGFASRATGSWGAATLTSPCDSQLSIYPLTAAQHGRGQQKMRTQMRPNGRELALREAAKLAMVGQARSNYAGALYRS